MEIDNPTHLLVFALLEYLASCEPEDGEELVVTDQDPDDFGEVYWDGRRFRPFPGREDDDF